MHLPVPARGTLLGCLGGRRGCWGYLSAPHPTLDDCQLRVGEPRGPQEAQKHCSGPRQEQRCMRRSQGLREIL